MRANRAGTATVELAVCLPAIVLLVIVSIESCSMIFLNQTLCVAAYEGARVAIRKDATNAAVEARCNEILDARQVVGAVIKFHPGDVSTVLSGTHIHIEVEAPCDANSIMPPWFFGGSKLKPKCEMAKE